MKKNILFFDGFCHLCNGYINFLVRLSSDKFLFASIQGSTAKKYLTPEQISQIESVLYYKNEKLLKKSDAVIESLFDVSPLFFWIKIFYLIPFKIRNYIYNLIARYRYKLFGKSDTCRIPTDSEKLYLLD